MAVQASSPAATGRRVPPGFRVYIVGDPRDAVLSIFRRGLQIGHFRSLNGIDPGPHARQRLETLETFLAAGVDDFGLAHHVDGWLAHPDGYPVLFVRYEQLAESWDTLSTFVGLEPGRPAMPIRTRSSNRQELGSPAKEQLDLLYGDLAARIDAASSNSPRRMIVTTIYPSSHQRAGGVTMLYEFATPWARGHEVHFVHGPKRHDRDNLVERIEQVPFGFDAAVHHHIVATLDDPSLPEGDVVFGVGPRRLGQPAVFIQGFRLDRADLGRIRLSTARPKSVHRELARRRRALLRRSRGAARPHPDGTRPRPLRDARPALPA